MVMAMQHDVHNAMAMAMQHDVHKAMAMQQEDKCDGNVAVACSSDLSLRET